MYLDLLTHVIEAVVYHTKLRGYRLALDSVVDRAEGVDRCCRRRTISTSKLMGSQLA